VHIRFGKSSPKIIAPLVGSALRGDPGGGLVVCGTASRIPFPTAIHGASETPLVCVDISSQNRPNYLI